MKVGVQLLPDHGIDASLEDARRADEQGFDSVWLSDHLFNYTASGHRPDVPPDQLTLAAAIGATTKRIRIAWAMLNVTLRPPVLLAKTLATLDQITSGRVIATLGSGWNKDEWHAYNLPLIEDHDERAVYSHEVIQLFKHLWTHPAPEITNFDGRYVQARNLPFNPAPFQKPHPPIWFGGQSDATLRTVKELCDGWVTLSGRPERLRAALDSPDWPSRPMTVVKGAYIIVRKSHAEAVDAANSDYEMLKQSLPQVAPTSFDEFYAREIIGTPAECLAAIAEIESRGVNYLRVNFQSEASQEAAARLLLPELAKTKNASLTR